MTKVFYLVILNNSQWTLNICVYWIRRYFFTAVFYTTEFSMVMLNNYIQYCKRRTPWHSTQILQSIPYSRNVLALQYTLKCNSIVANKKVQPCLHIFSILINVDIIQRILFQSKNNVENVDKFIYSSNTPIFMKLANAHLLYRILYIPYPTAFPYGNGMVLHFYQQQESSTTKTVHKVINKGLKTYV